MQEERSWWHVCFDDDNDWECISSHETRAEAEAELLRVRPRVPEAFLVRLTMTRMEQERTRPLLTVV